MIKQLVLHIGIFAQKSKFFNGPVHFKDHAPSPPCSSTYKGAWSSVSHQGPRPLPTMLEHIQGGVVIGESPRTTPPPHHAGAHTRGRGHRGVTEDHAPSPPCWSTYKGAWSSGSHQGPRPLPTMLEHIQGGVVIGESPRTTPPPHHARAHKRGRGHRGVTDGTLMTAYTAKR